MSSATMTLLGMYNFDNTIFDNLTFPVGIDKDTAVNEILLRSGEFEILYPDIQFLKMAIEHWGKKHYRTFDKWIEALSIEFDPLYNYDRFEEYTDERLSQGQQSRSAQERNSSLSQSGKDATSTTSDRENATANSISGTGTGSTSSGTTERQVSAYDEATYQPREKETNSNGTNGTGDGYAANQNITERNESVTDSGAEHVADQSQSLADENSSDNRSEQMKHTAHLYGNIGVTTSTQMLEDFIRVERFNIYEQLADIFVDEFCIMIY